MGVDGEPPDFTPAPFQRGLRARGPPLTLSASPYFFQNAGPVSAQHQTDLLVGITAADECGAQFPHAVWALEASDHFAGAMNVITAVSLGQNVLEFLCRREVIALNAGVGTHADMFNAHKIAHVVVVIDNIVDGH